MESKTQEAKKDIQLQPPFRVGRKQRRAVLDANGIEVGVFRTGSEEGAQKFCDWLNKAYEHPQADTGEREEEPIDFQTTVKNIIVELVNKRIGRCSREEAIYRAWLDAGVFASFYPKGSDEYTKYYAVQQHLERMKNEPETAPSPTEQTVKGEDVEAVKMETILMSIKYIFDSGANEIRIFDLVKMILLRERQQSEARIKEIEEERDHYKNVLIEIQNRGYDPYETSQHLIVKTWVDLASKALSKLK